MTLKCFYTAKNKHSRQPGFRDNGHLRPTWSSEKWDGTKALGAETTYDPDIIAKCLSIPFCGEALLCTASLCCLLMIRVNKSIAVWLKYLTAF